MQGDLRGIVRARRLSRATMANIRQNLFSCLRLQHAGRTGRRRCPVPHVRCPAQPNPGERSDDLQFRVRHPQRAAPPPAAALTEAAGLPRNGKPPRGIGGGGRRESPHPLRELTNVLTAATAVLAQNYADSRPDALARVLPSPSAEP